MNKFVCAVLAASALLGAMTQAQAEEARMRVKVSDLNVASLDGAKTALARIRFSAQNFCEAGAGRQSLERGAVVERCVADMTRKGVDSLRAPLVTALLEGRAAPAQPTQVAMAH